MVLLPTDIYIQTLKIFQLKPLSFLSSSLLISRNPSLLKLARDFYHQFPSFGDLLIKHFFDLQLNSFQLYNISIWHITWYFSIHAKHRFDQPSPFIILLNWLFYNKSLFSTNIRKKEDKKNKKNNLYNQKEKTKELWYLNFLQLLEDCMSLTLCPITNFFKRKTDFLIKMKNYIVTILS